MKPFDFPLLADENIHRDVVSFLRTSGSDVQSISEKKEFGLTGGEVLQWANAEVRVVLTHDHDFGGLALAGGEFIGIIYLRPGHILPEFTLATIRSIKENAPDVSPRFILVAEQANGRVRIRVRQV